MAGVSILPQQQNGRGSPGLLSVVVFYLMILIMGIWASRKSKIEEKKCSGKKSEITMIGGRNLNIWVSIFTTTATWVGGGFILGNAEVVYMPNKGLIWAIGPIGYSLSLVIGGLFFIKPMRGKNYVTIMDPFQEKYGDTLTGILLIPSLLADIFWVACILAALGGTMSVILDIPSYYTVVISAAVAILYTLLGGMYSVAYTDIIQLIFMFLSLWFCVPFMLTSPASADITFTAVNRLYQEPWLGRLQVEDMGRWMDDLLLVTLCGVCYQAFYQRILAVATDKQAHVTCYVSAVFCAFLAVPPLIIGAVAASTDWNQTSFGLPTPYEQDKAGMILPLSLQHLCPPYVSIAGIGAIAAAVMSSVDSAMLSFASLSARNIYKNILKKKASEKEITYVMKVCILLIGCTGMGLAMTTSSVYVFWILSGDVMYTSMFPQVVCLFFLPDRTNGYGAATGFGVGLLLRCLMGETTLGIPPVIWLPGSRLVDGVYEQRFPFRSLIVLVSFAVILLVSHLASFLFHRGFLPERWDVFKLRQTGAVTLKDVALKEPNEETNLDTSLPSLPNHEIEDVNTSLCSRPPSQAEIL
ncbi:hypothetical protein AGOR_G00129220 [Albula goreensis]|uniref:High affinity choline transporter 1-like n=1 Tax=Albula goreensis TaxID=1534307 RepID=A0A8T3DG79_9TELE|nr:hypothetical protein AGOR_G00129220 [Albula goreensis]